MSQPLRPYHPPSLKGVEQVELKDKPTEVSLVLTGFKSIDQALGWWSWYSYNSENFRDMTKLTVEIVRPNFEEPCVVEPGLVKAAVKG